MNVLKVIEVVACIWFAIMCTLGPLAFIYTDKIEKWKIVRWLRGERFKEKTDGSSKTNAIK